MSKERDVSWYKAQPTDYQRTVQSSYQNFFQHDYKEAKKVFLKLFEYEKKLEYEELLHDLWFDKKMDQKILTKLNKQYKPSIFTKI